MNGYKVSDEELEHIGIELNIARKIANYLKKVDKRTRVIILEALLERGAPEKEFYSIGEVRFRYRGQPETTPNKEMLAREFGLEAVVDMASIANKDLELFLRKQGLSSDYSKYLVEGKKHLVLDTPEIKPVIENERINNIRDVLIKQAVATNKKS